jgi:hypothetical protein
MQLLQEIILYLSNLDEEKLDNETLHKVKKEITRKYKSTDLPTNIQLQKEYNKLVKE